MDDQVYRRRHRHHQRMQCRLVPATWQDHADTPGLHFPVHLHAVKAGAVQLVNQYHLRVCKCKTPRLMSHAGIACLDPCQRPRRPLCCRADQPHLNLALAWPSEPCDFASTLHHGHHQGMVLCSRPPPAHTIESATAAEPLPAPIVGQHRIA